jgi:hypothetical protein
MNWEKITMSELESEYRKNRGSGSGTDYGYVVEARNTCADPVQIGGEIFDNKWRSVNTVQVGDGVGVPAPRYNKRLAEHGLLGYAAAQAIRWWFHASAESVGFGYVCLETRIIKCKLTYSHEVEAMSAHEIIGGEERTHIRPDWGKEE